LIGLDLAFCFDSDNAESGSAILQRPTKSAH
jgi:hypothetical protein